MKPASAPLPSLPAASQIELRHLRYFLRVAEELHFGRAAEMLGLSQAPLSQQIRQLEERLGVRLFDRTTRSVTLTAAGRVLHEKAQEMLSQIDAGLRDTQVAGGLAAGRLRISAVYVALYTFMPQAMRGFMAEYPSARVDMQMHTTEEQLQLLLDRKVDLAFVRPPRSASGIAYREIYREGFTCVLPADSPLTQKDELKFEDLRGQKFVTFSPIVGVSYQDVVLQQCRKAGFRPEIVQEVSHTLAIVTMAAAGMGIGVVPAWVEYTPMRGVAYRPIPTLPAAVALVIAWREDTMNPFVRPFVEHATRAAREMGG